MFANVGEAVEKLCSINGKVIDEGDGLLDVHGIDLRVINDGLDHFARGSARPSGALRALARTARGRRRGGEGGAVRRNRKVERVRAQKPLRTLAASEVYVLSGVCRNIARHSRGHGQGRGLWQTHHLVHLRHERIDRGVICCQRVGHLLPQVEVLATDALHGCAH